MLELDVDMAAVEGDLADGVLLHDEAGEMPDMRFVPEQRRTVRPCDCAALLALAKELEGMAFADGGTDGGEPVMSRGGCAVLAARIREACGEGAR